MIVTEDQSSTKKEQIKSDRNSYRNIWIIYSCSLLVSIHKILLLPWSGSLYFFFDLKLTSGWFYTNGAFIESFLSYFYYPFRIYPCSFFLLWLASLSDLMMALFVGFVDDMTEGFDDDFALLWSFRWLRWRNLCCWELYWRFFQWRC